MPNLLCEEGSQCPPEVAKHVEDMAIKTHCAFIAGFLDSPSSTEDPETRSVQSGEIWTHDTFNINKLNEQVEASRRERIWQKSTLIIYHKLSQPVLCHSCQRRQPAE